MSTADQEKLLAELRARAANASGVNPPSGAAPVGPTEINMAALPAGAQINAERTHFWLAGMAQWEAIPDAAKVPATPPAPVAPPPPAQVPPPPPAMVPPPPPAPPAPPAMLPPAPAPPPPAMRQQFNNLWYVLRDNAWVLDTDQGAAPAGGSGQCNCKPGGKGRGPHKADCPARKASGANSGDDVALTDDELWDRVRDGFQAMITLATLRK